MTRLVSRCILYNRGVPSEPPISNSSYHLSDLSMPPASTLTFWSRWTGSRATAVRPPLRAPGVMLVTLSMKRCVATSVNFIVPSRLTEARNVESLEKAVPSTQSVAAPW